MKCEDLQIAVILSLSYSLVMVLEYDPSSTCFSVSHSINICYLQLTLSRDVAGSLRIMQRVEKIQVPSSWPSLELKTLEEISWEEKQFEVCKYMEFVKLWLSAAEPIFSLNYNYFTVFIRRTLG